MSKNKVKKPLTKKQRRRKRRRILLVIEFIALIILSLLVYMYSKFGKIDFNDLGNVKKNNLDAKTQELLKGYTTIALFGVDSREMDTYKNAQSDSIIVCVIDNKNKEIRLMSVFRDTYMDVDKNNVESIIFSLNQIIKQIKIRELNKKLNSVTDKFEIKNKTNEINKTKYL